tara:strand:+ start:1175 stop:1642 length:468 start_codon:yes stop_codon:yes gene_type:complete
MSTLVITFMIDRESKLDMADKMLFNAAVARLTSAASYRDYHVICVDRAAFDALSNESLGYECTLSAARGDKRELIGLINRVDTVAVLWPSVDSPSPSQKTIEAVVKIAKDLDREVVAEAWVTSQDMMELGLGDSNILKDLDDFDDFIDSAEEEWE